MDLVRELLRRSDLQKYGDAFEKNGYDSVKQLAQMKQSDFDKLGELTHMLPDHVHRLQTHIRDAMRMQRASLQSSTAATASATAAVAGPAKGTPVDGPEGPQFCIPCGPAAPATNESNTA